MEKYGPSVKKLLDNMKNEANQCGELYMQQTGEKVDVDEISDDSQDDTPEVDLTTAHKDTA